MFEVARDANKIEIKRAVETAVRLKVAERAHAHRARQGQAPGPFVGPAAGLEEGVRRLREGEKMTEFFEGA